MESVVSSANQHLPVFIHDLAVILCVAGVVSIVFKWLRQPVVLGYMVAGILVGPHFTLLPTVTDTANVKLWGEIGVLFVLFSLGLEFSFQRLMRVGGGAAVTAIVQTSMVFCLGMLIALLLGWSQIDAIFWGGMMSISSTTIIFKVFEENGLKSRKFAQLVMGVLIVEDLVAVLLLVLLSTVAVTREFTGLELMLASGRLLFFLILWFVIGLFVLPRMMKNIRQLLTPETMLIFSVGLCLLMVLIATGAGMSPALGAFVMGSLLAETSEGPRIEKLLHPLKDFFGAVFFVSVGMLFDPQIFATSWHLVLGMSLFLICAKAITVWFGASVAGQSVATSVRAGFSLAQIGEFSFIIGALGMSLKVISEELYPLVVGVALVTSFTTPYLIKFSEPAANWIERALPRHWLERLHRYQLALQRQQGTRLLPTLISAYAPLTLINAVLIIATAWLMRQFAYPWMLANLGDRAEVRAAVVALTLVACGPFFYGLCFRRAHARWREQLSAFPRAQWYMLPIAALRFGVGVVLAVLLLAQFLSWKTLSGVVLITLGGLVAAFYVFGERIYRRLERQFLGHFTAGKSAESAAPLVPWDHHLSELLVGPDSPLVGMTLAQIGPQESFGVVVAAIERGQRRLLAPRASDQVFPGDRLQVLGSDDGVERIRRLAELTDPPIIDELPLCLQSVVLHANSPVCGRLLRDSDIRGLVDGLVVGVEREGFRQLHPPPDLRLEAGDRLWIVGDPDKITRLNGEPPA